ncbi:putative small multi-drug export [Alkaliphilus metalliredigens QYMF]|uniref:Putative small multi-drug export n=2 Tax=Alkaliphilus TaxID=114627 RepID=A6TJZ3_ALKMQ|nr:putative small multi-drug export [Alkaliphilus metalliredigens QYMF]
MSPLHATMVSFAGSMLPVPFLICAIRPVFDILKKTRLFGGMIHRLSARTLRNSEKVKKYGFWGLILFVSIPLPGTGVWSGTLAAVLLDMRFKIAFPAILIGNTIAAIVIMTLSYGALGAINLLP